MTTMMMTSVKRLWNETEAANAVEYGLITAVIAIALIAALVFFRTSLVNMFTKAGNQVTSASS
jgi:Flp pilus assembly pilin Flp